MTIEFWLKSKWLWYPYDKKIFFPDQNSQTKNENDQLNFTMTVFQNYDMKIFQKKISAKF